MIDKPVKSEEVLPDLFSSRLIVLLETKAWSNQYLQIMLTKEKWEKFSEFMKSMLEECKDETHDHTVPHSEIYLNEKVPMKVHESIENYYPEEYIKS